MPDGHRGIGWEVDFGLGGEESPDLTLCIEFGGEA